MTETLTPDQLQFIVRKMADLSVLKPTAEQRFEFLETYIAETGTWKGLPVKAWTVTDEGKIFVRQEVFKGLANDWMMRSVLGQIQNSDLIEADYYGYDYRTHDDARRYRQAVAAAYGVVGHEMSHAAYSEHCLRSPWQMILEDLRIESLWLDADPVRARQALRACAQFWVAKDASPIDGVGTDDVRQFTSKVDLLHAYVMFVGRARIGVLADGSKLVTGIKALATEVLGWLIVSEADSIIDRYLETARDHLDPIGIAERQQLAKEMADLVKGSQPQHGGCGCRPDSKDGDTEDVEIGVGTGQGEGDDDDSDDQPGNGEAKSESQEEGETQSETESGQEDGDGDGTDGTAQEDGDGDGDDTGTGTQAGDDDDDTDADADDGTGEGDIDADADGTGSEHGEDGEQDADGSGESFEDATGEYGQDFIPNDAPTGSTEETADDSEKLDPEALKKLQETLVEGLQEVSGDDGTGAGWELTREDAERFRADRISPVRIAREVFSARARGSRNRRLKG